MSDQVMSAGLLGLLDVEKPLEHEESRVGAAIPQPAARWNQEDFAREQIHSLVRQVFFSNTGPAVRQVVFSAMESETEVHPICVRVAETLARETVGSVAVLTRNSRALLEAEHPDDAAADEKKGMPLRRVGVRLRSNLWLVPTLGDDSSSTSSLHACLAEMRREFEFSIVEAPPAGESHQSTAMAQFADGIILVLSAHHTRRVTARKIKENLEAARARILGTVLSDRLFPIPERLYRRL